MQQHGGFARTSPAAEHNDFMRSAVKDLVVALPFQQIDGFFSPLQHIAYQFRETVPGFHMDDGSLSDDANIAHLIQIDSYFSQFFAHDGLLVGYALMANGDDRRNRKILFVHKNIFIG